MIAKPFDEIAADNSFAANGIASTIDTDTEYDRLADKQRSVDAAVSASPRVPIVVVEGTQVLVDGVVYGSGEIVDAPKMLAAQWIRDGYAVPKPVAAQAVTAPFPAATPAPVEAQR